MLPIDSKILILFLYFLPEGMKNVKKARVHLEVSEKGFKNFFRYFQFCKRE